MITYTVKKGDTLSKIAARFGTSVSAIQKLNSAKINNVNVIQVGWTLNIPEHYSYAEIGKQMEKALKDVQNLSSVKKLMEMLGE